MVDAVAPLRIPRFRALWLAAIFSNLGSFLQAVAASWLMLELTGSATWVGLMAASATLPLLFLALAAGAVADMFDRRWVLVAAQSTMGLAATLMALLTWMDVVTPAILLALGLLLGVGLAFNLPSWQATVPDLVPRGMVASAVALNSVAFNVARAVGPALGGLIIVVSGAQTAFAINAFSYLGIILVLIALARSMPTPDRPETSMRNAIGVGIRFARFTKPFRRVLILAALFALTSAVVQAVLPNRTEQLGGDAGTFGILLGAMGFGALVGGLSREPVTSRLGRLSLPLTVALFGVSGIGLGLASSTAAAASALFVAGMAWVWTLANLNATAQLMSPEWVRGRAMGLYTLAFVGILPVGSIIAGALADRIGADGAEIVLSVGAVVLGLVIAPLLGIPALDDVETPEFTEDRDTIRHVETEGGPVLVMNTWHVNDGNLSEFFEVMNEVRLVRLRTGAYRWRLYRDTEDPHSLTEVFLTVSWNEHLAQHERIDDAAATTIRRARSLDRGEGPSTTHLVAVDIDADADWES
ncbi:MAG: MFS transporter, partial [Acidimicrobiia bacterium]